MCQESFCDSRSDPEKYNETFVSMTPNRGYLAVFYALLFTPQERDVEASPRREANKRPGSHNTQCEPHTYRAAA